jgi:hypothetical protein
MVTKMASKPSHEYVTSSLADENALPARDDPAVSRMLYKGANSGRHDDPSQCAEPPGDHPKADRLLPYMMKEQLNKDQVSLRERIRNDLLTLGYSVVPSVLSSDECNEALDQVWDFIEDCSHGYIQRQNPKSWYHPSELLTLIPFNHEVSSLGSSCEVMDNKNDQSDPFDSALLYETDPWPCTGYKSFLVDMFQSFGSGFVFSGVRELLAERVFSPLFGTSKLHASKEGFTMHRPTIICIPSEADNGDEKSDEDNDLFCFPNPSRRGGKAPAVMRVCAQDQFLSRGEHWDQPSRDVGLTTIQSVTSLEDQVSDCDGCFLAYPGSFGDVHQQMTRNIYRGKNTWIPLTDSELTYLTTTLQIQPVKVYLKKGDVLIFRSDLVHAPLPPSAHTPRFRAVVYCSMQPAKLTPTSVLQHKMNAYKQRETSDHRPHEENYHRHPSILFDPKTTGQEPVQKPRPYYRTSPPIVTVRQAELYGLIPYTNTMKELRKAIRQAIIQGVRFLRSDPRLEAVSQADLDDTSAEWIPTLEQIGIPGLYSSVRPRSIVQPARLQHLRLHQPSDQSHPETPNGSRKRDSNAPKKEAGTERTGSVGDLLIGQDKYLGGMSSPCGRYVYGVPGSAARVLRIRTSDGYMDMIGPTFHGKFKWLRGVEVPARYLDPVRYPSGCCLALPSNEPSILKINPATNEVYSFGQETLARYAARGWLYHGGNLAECNGCVYAIPANANRVIKINPMSDEVTFIGPTFNGDLGQQWFGGITGSDGCIYGIPHNQTGVLRIDPVSDTVSIVQDDANSPLPDGKWKWHGGLRAGDKIYGFPNNASSVLVINCSDPAYIRVYTVGDSSTLQSGRHRIPQDHRYKYLGGALSHDGLFAYLFPCDAERVLRIDCTTDELTLVGPLLLDGENKFQNGFTAQDGRLYGIPQRATGIICVTPASVLWKSLLQSSPADEALDHVDIIDCGDNLVGVKDKFEGGVLGADKNM